MSDVLGFEEFYEATRQRVGAFLYAIGGDLTEAQDAAQEAYTRAWERWNRVGSYDDPEAWVRMVGYRIMINAWQRARHRLLAHRRLGRPVPYEPAPETALTVHAALRALPPDQRLVVVLHYLLDLPVTEIARQTDVPVNTVKSRLSRGRSRLATMIGSDLPEEAANA
jgi:RNA polymerase sigma-70 factor (sigma-E family)